MTTAGWIPHSIRKLKQKKNVQFQFYLEVPFTAGCGHAPSSGKPWVDHIQHLHWFLAACSLNFCPLPSWSLWPLLHYVCTCARVASRWPRIPLAPQMKSLLGGWLLRPEHCWIFLPREETSAGCWTLSTSVTLQLVLRVLAVSADPTFSTMTPPTKHTPRPHTHSLSQLLHNHHSVVSLTAHNELSGARKPRPPRSKMAPIHLHVVA